MFCFKCGAEIPDKSEFCMKCGVKIPTITEKVSNISNTVKQYPEIVTGTHKGNLCEVIITEDCITINKKPLIKRIETTILFNEIVDVSFYKSKTFSGGYLHVTSTQNLSETPKSQFTIDPYTITFVPQANEEFYAIYQTLLAVADYNDQRHLISKENTYEKNKNKEQSVMQKVLYGETGATSMKEFQQIIKSGEYTLPTKTSEKKEKPLSKHQRIKENKKNGIACCPKCGSTSLSSGKQGFGIGKAVIGAGLVSNPIGLVAGNIHSKKVDVTCLNCGHKWKI